MSIKKMILIGLLPCLLLSCETINDFFNKGEIPEDIKGTENLGAGYDVFDNYADVLSLKAKILDVEAMDADGLIEYKTIDKGVFKTISGESIDEYASSLNTTTKLDGSYRFFSGSIETNFSQDRYQQTQHSFATVQSLVNKHGIRVGPNYHAVDLIPYLTAKAKEDINDPNYSGENLFAAYGTHCVTGLILGGRLDYSVTADMSKVESSKSIAVFAEASFDAMFASASASNSTVSSEEMASFNQQKEKRLEIYGGAAEYGQNIINDNDYSAWINSISTNYIFCDFQDQGLIPIWEFCDDATRKAELEESFDTWAEERQIIIGEQIVQCIVDLKVLTAGRWDDLPETLEGGYKIIGHDLNSGAGGDYIALYYKLGASNIEGGPINEIFIQNTSDGEGINGGTKIDVDLNKGAGGDFIYLVYKRGAERPITGIAIEDGDKWYSDGCNSQNTFYWVMEQNNPSTKQDLNEGAGGNYIYIGYTYDRVN